MRVRTLAAFWLCQVGVTFAQPVLEETVDFPRVRPGPAAMQSGSGCFHLAHGTIFPGDVDWVQITLPRSTTQTVVDIDFPAGTAGSALLASVVGGTTAFNMGDNNNTRDALCGLSGSTFPAGSTRDSAANLNATARNIVINIGITGAEDSSFTGAHTQSFDYDVWVYAATVSCTSNADCNDGVACTSDVCNLSTGICANADNDAACDNGLFCDGEEFCDGARGCRAGFRPNCDDGVDCTYDECDADQDACVFLPDDGFCDDGEFCNGAEVCDVRLDCVAGASPTCDDGVGCTVDFCDPRTDACANETDDSLCDDGRWCNGAESCDAVLDCRAGVAPDCDDAVGCTVDSCDESADACVNDVDDSQCDDGRFCNGVESCDALLGCQAGAAPSCDDDVDCTVDRCDATRDACVHSADDSACDDGRFCNGFETCDAVDGCQVGVAPDCSDGVGCTVDSCDESLDQCENRPDDEVCDNGLFCDGAESCDPDLGCQAGDAPCGGLCRESDDRCVECLSSADCNDGDFCNGAESCAADGSCSAGAPPCPPGLTCNAQTRQCESGLFTLDAKPGACPNRFGGMGQGYFAFAITGGPGANVRQIDPASLRLSRVDGVGGVLTPNLASPGPRPSVEDVATPFVGSACGCNAAGADGQADLLFQFPVQSMKSSLSLNAAGVVTLRVRGMLRDGTPIEVTDCVTVDSPNGRDNKR